MAPFARITCPLTQLNGQVAVALAHLPTSGNEPLMSYQQAALLTIRMSRRYRADQHHHHNGFPQHAFATLPWLGAAVVALIVLAGLVLAINGR
jgi:hypothetical protein